MSSEEGSSVSIPKPVLMIGGAILAVIVLLGGIFVISNIGVKGNADNRGKQWETQLNAEYPTAQIALSDCVQKVQGVASAANTNAEKVDQVISDAVKGRYTVGSTAQPGKGTLFSAITEAYPSTANVTELYDRFVTTLNGCTTDYNNEQKKLLDMLRGFDKWRLGTRIGRHYAADRYPDQDLVARIGAQSWRGKDAYDKMWTVILTSNALEAYRNGELKPGDLNPLATTVPR